MQDKASTDGSSIIWSIVVLIACLAFLYLIFFGVERPADVGADGASQGEKLAQVLPEDGSQSDTIDRDLIDEDENTPIEGEDSQQSGPVIAQIQMAAGDNAQRELTGTGTQPSQAQSPSQPTNQPEQESPGTVVADGKTFFSVQELFEQVNEDTDGMVPLSGTFVWEGALRSLVDLGLIGQEEYVLKTVENDHFAYLGSFTSRTIPLLESLGGNIVEISDKNAIYEHGLFGDKIWFLNTQRYQELEKVIYIVFFDQTNDARFVQMDRDQYYKSKTTTQKIFDPWYDW